MSDRSPLEVGLVEQLQDRMVATVAGEIDHTTSADFTEAIGELFTEGMAYVVLDMTEVGFCDSSGIGALVDILRLARRRNGTLVLATPPGSVSRALGLAGLADLIPSFPTIPDALEALTSNP